MPTKLIAGNWKMNGLVADGVARARELALRVARQGAGVEVLICPPATILFPIAEEVSGSGLKVGGQDCHAMDSGAFTGEIAAAMLANVGCSYVIVGHSERRQYHAEIDLQVSEKAAAAHRNGLSAIVCIGETEEERDAGKTLAVVSRQLAGSLPRGATADNTVVAYEPVWAIGTGRTPTAAEIAEVHAHIRAELAGRAGDPERLRILYGGSMKPTNAVEILSIPNVDGGLVGGASLKVDEFWPIVQAAIR